MCFSCEGKGVEECGAAAAERYRTDFKQVSSQEWQIMNNLLFQMDNMQTYTPYACLAVGLLGVSLYDAHFALPRPFVCRSKP